jgi:tetratricopeptide (TPR) repeat protein
VDTNTQFQGQFEAGRAAFERGQYRLSVQLLQEASQQVAFTSRQGGEVQTWLVTAYQAMGKSDEAKNLCRQLTHHPIYSIRTQAKQVLYILEAPQLQRPPEWMSTIPDLEKLPDSEPKYQKGQNPYRPAEIPEVTGQVNTQDNRFIWVALGLILLLLGGSVWFG